MLQRLRQFFQSTYHQIVDGGEEADSKLKYYFKDIEKEIISVKEVISKQLQVLDQFQKQHEEAKQLVIKREKQAHIAQKAREEELARKALMEKTHYEAKIVEYQAYVSETETGIKQLKEQLYVLEREYLNLLDKKNNLIAKLTRDKAKKRIQNKINSLQSEQILHEFQQIHNQINELNMEKNLSSEDDLDEIDAKISELEESKNINPTTETH